MILTIFIDDSTLQEHEKRKDKRRRIANRRKGLKSARKVYAMVSYLEMKKEYCSTSWENAARDEERDEADAAAAAAAKEESVQLA